MGTPESVPDWSSGLGLDTFKDIWELSPVSFFQGWKRFRYLQGYMGTFPLAGFIVVLIV